jgi:hypothetical protein
LHVQTPFTEAGNSSQPDLLPPPGAEIMIVSQMTPQLNPVPSKPPVTHFELRWRKIVPYLTCPKLCSNNLFHAQPGANFIAAAGAQTPAPTAVASSAFASSSAIPPIAKEPEVEGLASGVARLQLEGAAQKGSTTSTSNSNGNSNGNSNSNGSSGIESLTNQAPPTLGWRQEGQMLHEFSKLGKV